MMYGPSLLRRLVDEVEQVLGDLYDFGLSDDLSDTQRVELAGLQERGERVLDELKGDLAAWTN